MSKHDAGMHPISYAVWYEYAAGLNAGLRGEIDALLARQRRLTEDDMLALYRRHVADLDPETANRMNAELERIINEVSSSTAATGTEAATYASSLEDFATQLSPDQVPKDLGQSIVALLRDTRDIKGSLFTLQRVLDESRAEVQELRAELQQAREEAIIDALTGLANRKGFDQSIAVMVRNADEDNGALCLVLVDIDHFKRVNDAHGHLLGDRVIRAVAGVLKSSVKGKDAVARYGGEEFAILLPDTPLSGAQAVAEQVRSLVSRSQIRRIDKNEIIGSVTISAGVARYSCGESIRAFINRADEALYASKANGRNQVTVAAVQ